MSDLKIQGEVSLDTSSADQAFGRVEQSARRMAQNVGQAGQQAGKGMDNIGNGGDSSAKKLDNATKSMIQSIQRTTAVMEAGSKTSSKYFETLAAQRGVDVNQLKPYLAQLDAVSSKQKDTGISAGQMSAALRGVPAQFTDIATSLASGQRPLQVFLQQGGQLKDMFGGIGPAARALGGYVVGLVNPFTLAAGAAAALAVAYSEGSKEADAYRKALILTGNAAGTTTAQMAAMAESISKSAGITKGAAASALTEFASTGQIAADQFQKLTATAVKLEQQTGIAVKDTVKQFVELGKAPVAASIKLNETTNYLTKSIYDQIKALVEQGKTAEAAAVAQTAYNDSLNDRIPKLVQNLGYVERAWKNIVAAMKGAVDSALDFGRKADPADTVQRALESSYARLAKLRQLGSGKDTLIAIAEEEKRAAALSKQAEALALLTRQKEKDAAADAKRKKEVEAYDQFSKLVDKADPRTEQMRKEIEAAQNQGAAANATEKQVAAVVASIKRQYADVMNYGVDALKQQQSVEKQVLAGQMDDLESKRKQGLITEEDYYAKKLGIQLKGLDKERQIIQEEIRVATEKNDLPERKKYLADLSELEARRKNIIKAASNDIADSAAANAKLVNAQAATWRNATQSDQELLQQQVQMFGKSAEAQKILTEQNKVDADVRKLIANRILENKPLSEAEIVRLKAEAEARKVNIGTIMGEQQARAGAEELRKENRRFAADSIADERDRAAALLEIDSETWRERIRLAGEGTEAQKLLQQEFDQWYANRQMSPVLDRWKNIIGNLDSDFREGFRDMLSNGQDAWKSFSKALGNTLKTSLADALYQTFIKKYVVQVVAGLAGAISGPAVASSLAGTAVTAGNVAGAGAGLYSASNALGISGFGSGLAAGAGGSDAAMLAYASNIGNVSTSASIGASIGSALPWIAAAAAVAAIVAKGLSMKTVGSGVLGTITGDSFSGNAYDFKKGGFLRGGSKTETSDLDKAVNDTFNTAIKGMYANFSNLGKTVGAGGDLLKDFSYEFRLALRDFDDAGKQKEIQRALSAMSDSMAQAFVDSFRTSIDTAKQAASQYFTNTIDGQRSFGPGQVVSQARTASPLDPVIDDIVRLFDKQREALTGVAGSEGKLATFTTQLFTLGSGLVENAGYLKLFGEALDFKKLEAAATGAETVVDAFGRLNTVFTATNGIALQLGQDALTAFGQVGLASADARQRLIDLSGGLDKLAGANTFFAENFLTEAERLAPVQKQVADEMARLGYAGVATKDEFKNLVRGLDLGSEAGAKLYAQLMAVAPAFSQVADFAKQAADQFIEAARQSAKERLDAAGTAVDSAFSGVQRAVEAQKTAVTAAYTATTTAIKARIDSITGSVSKLDTLSRSLGSTLDRISEPTDPAAARESAQAQIEAALAIARAGGPLPDADSLVKALDVVAQPNEQLFATFVDYKRDSLRAYSNISELQKLTEKQKSVQEQILDATKAQLDAEEKRYQDEIKALDDQLNAAQAQIDAIKGVDTSIKSVAQAIAGLGTALGSMKVAQQVAAPQVTSQGATAELSAVERLYLTYAGKTASQIDDQGGAYWAAQFNSGKSLAEIEKAFQDSVRAVRGFAVGTNYVPSDMFAKIHEGERIVPKADNQAMIAALQSPQANNEVLVAEIKALRAEVVELRRVAEKSGDDTRQLVELVDNVTEGGNAMRSEVLA